MFSSIKRAQNHNEALNMTLQFQKQNANNTWQLIIANKEASYVFGETNNSVIDLPDDQFN